MPEPITTADAGGTATATSGSIGTVDAGSAKSDEQLIGLEPDGYRAEVPEPEATGEFEEQSTETTEHTADATETTDETATEEIASSTAFPEWAKQLAAQHPDAKPQLQRLWDQHQAFREIFPTVREAREMRDLFPGGALEAKAVVEKATEMDTSDNLFFSHDANAQRELAQNMYQRDPEAFSLMYKVSGELIRQSNPQAFQQELTNQFSSLLKDERFDVHLDLIQRAVQNNDADALKQLASDLVGWAKTKGLVGEQKPLAQKPDVERQRFDQERSDFVRQQAETFSTSVNTASVPKIEEAAKAYVEPVVRTLPAHARQGASKSLISQMKAGVEERLRGDRFYHEQMNQIVYSQGRNRADYSPNASRKAAELIVSRAKLHLKAVAKDVLEAWTPRQIQNAKDKLAQAKTAASRPDVTGGGLTASRVKTKLTRDDARSMSDSQIVEWAQSRK